MSTLTLVLPETKYKEDIMDYKREFIESGDSMDGTSYLSVMDTFEEWYEAFLDNQKEETLREGVVPATNYLALDQKGRMVGMVNIRFRLNAYLYNFGGHIGYSVRKSERRKGYATEMLRQTLEKCKEFEMKEVLITCDKSNIASAKTIISNGGVLENEVMDEEEVVQRYWIMQ